MFLKTTWVFYIAPVLICVSWLVPGILLVLMSPSLAQAWLRGIIPRIPATPWKDLLTGQKVSVYFFSSLCFIGAVGVLITMIANANIR
jgi:ABC-type glycerol-3-phosphate transport system permease component